VLVSSEGLSGSALPEAAVAAIALGRSDVKTQVAERLLSGQLPVLPDDLPQLARNLGVENDPRVRPLQNSLRQAPDVADLPLAPAFRRSLTERDVLEGWSRTHEDEIRFFEVPVSALLNRAGVSNRAWLNRTMHAPEGAATVRIAAVPDVDEFRLMVA